MSIIREILRSDVQDLTIVAYAGPDVGMLCAAGKVKKLIFGFATMDAIPLEPYYRKARESGQIEVMELDEGMLQWGLRAAGMRVPFLPTRCGLATDIVKYNPELKTVTSPYEDGELLLTMPALKLDVVLLHVNEADRLGNTLITGPDAYFDHHYARAADKCFVSTERLVDKLELDSNTARANTFERYLVHGVVEAPLGAHPTSCPLDYGLDMEHLKKYAASAKQDDGWSAYMKDYVLSGEDQYQQNNGGKEHMASLPLPIY